MKHIIHVHQANIRANAKGAMPHKPVLIVRSYRGSHHTNMDVLIDTPCRLIYRPDKPLKCGAKVWVETDANTVLLREGVGLKLTTRAKHAKDTFDKLIAEAAKKARKKKK